MQCAVPEKRQGRHLAKSTSQARSLAIFRWARYVAPPQRTPTSALVASQQLTSVASGSTTTFVAQDDKLPQFGPKSVVAAIEAVKAGKIIVVTDDEDRENEGDLIMAAEFATPETIGFIRRYSSGVICVAVRCRMLASQQKGSW